MLSELDAPDDSPSYANEPFAIMKKLHVVTPERQLLRYCLGLATNRMIVLVTANFQSRHDPVCHRTGWIGSECVTKGFSVC